MKKLLTIKALTAILLALSLTVSARQGEPGRMLFPVEDQLDKSLMMPEEAIGMKVEPTMLGKTALRSTQSVNEAGDKILVFAYYTYDGNNHLTGKNESTFDSMNRQTSNTNYIHNDYSQAWMSGREDMICSYKMNRTNSNAGYATYYETYYLDWSTGKLKGDQKYFEEFNEIAGIESFNLSKESFVWNDSIDNWVANTKYSCEYERSGNEMSEVDFNWDWNENTKTWIKNTSFKRTYQYLFQNNYWFTTEARDSVLMNDEWVCNWEFTGVPNISTKSYQSRSWKKFVNNQLINDLKYIYTFTATDRNLLTEYFIWKDNDWNLISNFVYEYSTPDSVATRTNSRTPAYYQYYGLKQPSLCTGLTMYPYQKYISKYNPAFGTELSYTYLWDITTCNWKPGGQKFVFTLDESGKNSLTRIICASFTATEWTNCEFTTNTYYPNGKLKETIISTDGYPEQQKSVYTYLEDSLVTRIDFYNSIDNNNDGLITGDEWSWDGYQEYVHKYNRTFDTDSVHISIQKPGFLTLYNLENVKQLKVTGTIGCNDLKYIAELSWKSLQLVDLSDATIEGDTLYGGCFGEIGLNTLILPKNLIAIEIDAIRNTNEYGYSYDEFWNHQLKTLIVYPSLEYLSKGGIRAIYLENISIRSDLLNMVFELEWFLPRKIEEYKSNLTSITFNDSSGKIKDAVCYNLPNLKSVTILDGVSEIGNNAFKSCGMLSSIQLPPTTLRKIGYNAFWGCNELTSLTIPEGTTAIDYSAFWGCSGITSINMPSTLADIAQNVFWGCSAVSNMNVAAVAPPALGNNALIGIPRTASLVVPPSGFYTYKVTPQWKEFYIESSGLTMNDANSILVLGTNNQLQLQNIPEKASVQVFNVAGVKLIDLIDPGTNVTLDLNQGLYLVKIGDLRFKAVVQ